MEEQVCKTVSEDTMQIMRPSWDNPVYVTVRGDYIDEIKRYKWSINNGYPYNGKLGFLHLYVMRKWYGDEICNKMQEESYVVDHIDNNHKNATISNLAFLSHPENVAKGQTWDKYNKEKMYIALSIFKDFQTKLFQVTINFNYPAKILHPDVLDEAVLLVAYLLYEDDYVKVLHDCHQILHEYYSHYTISPIYLRCIDYDLEGFYEQQGTKEAYDYYISGKHGRGVCFFHSRAYIKGWNQNNKIERFYLHPPLKNKKDV